MSERIPPAGKWFRLDKNTGQEDIYVYATKRPSRIEDILARVKADAESDRQAAAKAARRPATGKIASGHGRTGAKGPRHAENDVPGAVTSETRALELVDDTPPEAGITRKHFTIRLGE